MSREYGSREGLSCKTGWISKCEGTMEMFLRSCTSFTLQHFLPGKGRKKGGMCMIFAACIFRYIYVCVRVCFGRHSFCLFPSREGLIIPIQNTSHGPRPQSIVLLVSFQKDTVRRARRPRAKGQQKKGNFAFILKRKNNPHLFSSQSITIQENVILSFKKHHNGCHLQSKSKHPDT